MVPSLKLANCLVNQLSAFLALLLAFFFARSASARALALALSASSLAACSSCSTRVAWVSVWISCSWKSEGTVWTEGVSTSIREEVEVDSSTSIWGGRGAAA